MDDSLYKQLDQCFSPYIQFINDLIQNRLAAMSVAGSDDLREVVTLRRALAEMHGVDAVQAGLLKSNHMIPRRGRRRKVHDIMGEHV